MQKHKFFISKSILIGIANDKPIIRISNKLAIKNEILKSQNILYGKIYSNFNIPNFCRIKECFAYSRSVKTFNLPFMSCICVNVNIELIYSDCFGCIHTQTIHDNIKFFNIPNTFDLTLIDVCVANPICTNIEFNQVFTNIPVIIYG